MTPEKPLATEEKAIVKHEDRDRFEFSPNLEHLAQTISKSTIIPKEFQGNAANCLIALELAHRIGAGILATMQSLYIVHGKPSWSGQFIIGAINNSRRFSQLKFAFNDDRTECHAYAHAGDGPPLKGPTVSIAMAKSQGWHANNNKWRDMPELMLMYRSGTFFGRVYCPDILLGMREQYEVLEAEAIEIREPKIPPISNGRNATSLPKEEPVSPPVKPTTQPQAAEAPKKPAPPVRKIAERLKVKLEPKNSPFESMGPNRMALNERLSVGGFSEAQFLMVCNKHEWLGQGRKWDSLDDVPDDMLELFLREDEWPMLQEQLEALVRYLSRDYDIKQKD